MRRIPALVHEWRPPPLPGASAREQAAPNNANTQRYINSRFTQRPFAAGRSPTATGRSAGEDLFALARLDAIAFVQDPFAQPDRLGRDLDELVVFDEFDGAFE